MGREETTLPPTFPAATAAWASGAEPAAASTRGGRRARGWRGPYRPPGDLMVGRAAVRAGPPGSFHSFSAEQIRSLLLPGRIFFPHFFFKSVGEGGEGAGKAPLSGLEKKGSSHILRERGWGGGGRKGRRRDREQEGRDGDRRRRVRGSIVNTWRTHLSPSHPSGRGSQKSDCTQLVRTARPVGGMFSYRLQTLRRRLAMTDRRGVLLKIQEGLDSRSPLCWTEARFTLARGAEGKKQALSASGGSR